MAAISLSDSIYKTKTDISSLRDSSKVSKEEMLECFKEMCSALHTGNRYNLKALKRKFIKEKYHGVSKIRLESK